MISIVFESAFHMAKPVIYYIRYNLYNQHDKPEEDANIAELLDG